MPLGHAKMRTIFSVARIFHDVSTANRTQATECWLKDLSITRHGKLGKMLTWHTRDGVQRVGLAFIIDYVVEKSAELRTGKLRGRVSHFLNNLFQIQICRKRAGGFNNGIQHFCFTPEILLGNHAVRNIFTKQNDAANNSLTLPPRLYLPAQMLS